MKVHYNDPYTPISGMIEATTWHEFLEKLTRAQADGPQGRGSQIYDGNPAFLAFHMQGCYIMSNLGQHQLSDAITLPGDYVLHCHGHVGFCASMRVVA